MGVVNVTPDSFSDGGHFLNHDKAIEHGLRLISEGADMLDIGGESTRPGAIPVAAAEEKRRILPVIEALAGQMRWISVDTRHAETMEVALAAGATIINDVSALRHDPRSVAVIAEASVPVILMHMQGTPETMQKNPKYNNVIKDIHDFFEERIKFCETNRIERENIVLDPGIGFGKTLEQNLLILKNLKDFSDLGCPLCLGVSRKSFIGKLSNDAEAKDRLAGSIAGALWGLSHDVDIMRVHDVRETKQAFDVWRAITVQDLSDI